MRHDLHSAGFPFRPALGLAPALVLVLELALRQGQSESRSLARNVSSVGSLQIIIKTKLFIQWLFTRNTGPSRNTRGSGK